MNQKNSNVNDQNFVSQWATVNKTVLLFKVLSVILAVAVLCLSVLVFSITRSNPVVVVVKDHMGKYFETGRKEPVSIDESDVKAFAAEFIAARYNWKEFDPKSMLDNVRPLVTEGFDKKLEDALEKEKTGAIKDKKVEESVANVEVAIKDNRIIADFDKILRIDGIPIIAPAEVELAIIRDNPTRFNLMGLFVNGLTEIERR